jgi:glycosyltransferase involved in cell wall biosynthesis
MDEVRGQISDADWARVHFVGRLPYDQFLTLLQISRVHVYLTYPFVLSWSLIEAMSTGCAIVASDTAPVLEAIEDGVTGQLVHFFDHQALVQSIADLLDQPDERARLGAQARARAIERYDLHTVCLPQQLAWVQALAA